MGRTTETDSASPRGRGSRDAGSVLDGARPFTASIPGSSVSAVRRVAKPDGRTRILAARVPGGPWLRPNGRLHLTVEAARLLQQAGISEVVLRRGVRRASFPLAWMLDHLR